MTQVSALRVDVQRLSQAKRSAEARALAAENAAQQCQQEVAALRVLTASMLAQPHSAPFQDLEGTESAKPGFTGEGSNSVVDTLTQQQGSRVRCLGSESVHLQQDSKCEAMRCNAKQCNAMQCNANTNLLHQCVSPQLSSACCCCCVESSLLVGVDLTYLRLLDTSTYLRLLHTPTALQHLQFPNQISDGASCTVGQY